MARAGRKVPQAVDACHQLLEWMMPLIDKYPRALRFTLGQRLETALLQTLEHLLEAAYSRTKVQPLEAANIRLAICGHLWRLSHSRRAVSSKSYAHGAQLLDGLGRQIGGWRSHAKQANASVSGERGIPS